MTPRTLSDPTIGEGVLEPTEPMMTFDEARAYIQIQVVREIIHRIRAEPGMDWLSPGTPEPIEPPMTLDEAQEIIDSIRAEPGMDWFHAEITSSREFEDDCPF